MQEEYAASGNHYIMYRPVINLLREALKDQLVSHLLLDGMPGSGKSVALAALAHWARLSGWVVR
jgi:predicted PilT family ATPase